jgi:hypothetical protein
LQLTRRADDAKSQRDAFCRAYRRKVITVHAASAASSKSCGLGPRSFPPTASGSSPSVATGVDADREGAGAALADLVGQRA